LFSVCKAEAGKVLLKLFDKSKAVGKVACLASAKHSLQGSPPIHPPGTMTMMFLVLVAVLQSVTALDNGQGTSLISSLQSSQTCDQP
jgi:hypothetical protein